jgi:hypothetical protein
VQGGADERSGGKVTLTMEQQATHGREPCLEYGERCIGRVEGRRVRESVRERESEREREGV